MKVEKTLENVGKCLCLQCPSYTKSCHLRSEKELFEKINNINTEKHFEVMFCAFEKSDCIQENRGCLCSQCPIHKKYALNNEDYCLSTGGVL